MRGLGRVLLAILVPLAVGVWAQQEQLARVKRLGMVLSCDPMFLDRSYPWLKVYGEDKANRIGPAKSLVSNGIMVTAEAEVDVESGTGPTYFAVQSHFLTRKNSKGDPVAPEEAVDRITLMKMMTTWPSYYIMKEKELGSLEVGKYADFVILNKDYFTIPEDQIPTAFPLATVLGGRTTVLRKELADEWGVQPIGPQLNFEFATRFRAKPERSRQNRHAQFVRARLQPCREEPVNPGASAPAVRC